MLGRSFAVLNHAIQGFAKRTSDRLPRLNGGPQTVGRQIDLKTDILVFRDFVGLVGIAVEFVERQGGGAAGFQRRLLFLVANDDDAIRRDLFQVLKPLQLLLLILPTGKIIRRRLCNCLP
ncbi:hypothetical protein [Agrobacterium salinitolerans]|uniref:hypothetical protein n=1 Tax=Agrobacterium salinitolerans TaxID=1183413 RepID=UPI00174B8EC3